MKMHTVEKLGGTSMDNMETVFKNVVHGPAAGTRRIFVVSAFSGVTDSLLESKRSGAPGVYALFASAENRTAGAWRMALEAIEKVLLLHNKNFLSQTVDRSQADQFVKTRISDARAFLENLQSLTSHGHFRLDQQLKSAREMLASIGEAHSAFVFALMLPKNGVPSRFVDLTGWEEDDRDDMDSRIERALNGIDLDEETPVFTGYAKQEGGLLAQYGRGYTEVTFSRAVVLSGAREGVIHKEVHLSSADPRIVSRDVVRPIARTNYDVADQLANLGMEAIHPRAAAGMRRADIPLRVRNTFEPYADGALIDGEYFPDRPGVDIVAGMQGITAFEVFEQDMVGVKGYDAAILETLSRHKVRIISKASNANTITHHVEISPKVLSRVIKDVETQLPNASVSAKEIALVSVIGACLDVPGITTLAVNALAQEQIAVIGMQQVTRGVDIQFLIAPQDYERGIRALHRTLVEKVGLKERVRPAA